MSKTSVRVLTTITLAFSAHFIVVASPCPAATISVGAMGDSLSDEYASFGLGYAANWLEQLATYDGVNFGQVGTYPSPRNTGYAYNWALAGATSTTLLSGGQASGLAAQIPTAGIGYAVLFIGANDFAPGNTPYDSIYAGVWTSAQINSYADGVIGNINTAVNTVLPTGVKLVVATVPDYNVTPLVKSDFPVAAQRQLVSNVVDNIVNPGILQIAQSDHLAVADVAGLLTATFGTNANPKASLTIGNVPIYLTQTTGSNPSQAAFCSDGVHPNTPIQGLLANLIAEALDTGYGAGVPLFTESQILAHNGITYGGSNTLTQQIGPYSNYVVNDVPELSTWTATASGSWSTAGNWNNRVPQNPGDKAVFGGAPTSTISVSLNGSEMAGGLSFSSSSNHGYAIVPGSGGALTLSNTAASIPVTVVSGTHSISAPIILDESLAVSVSGRAALQISGNLSESVTGAALSLTGGGELILSGSDSFNGGTNVEAGTLIVTNNEALPAGISLTVGAGGTLIFDPSASGSHNVAAEPLAVSPDPAVEAVPEPGTLALLGVGAIGLLAGRWRRRRSSSKANRRNLPIHPNRGVPQRTFPQTTPLAHTQERGRG